MGSGVDVPIWCHWHTIRAAAAVPVDGSGGSDTESSACASTDSPCTRAVSYNRLHERGEGVVLLVNKSGSEMAKAGVCQEADRKIAR